MLEILKSQNVAVDVDGRGALQHPLPLQPWCFALDLERVPYCPVPRHPCPSHSPPVPRRALPVSTVSESVPCLERSRSWLPGWAFLPLTADPPVAQPLSATPPSATPPTEAPCASGQAPASLPRGRWALRLGRLLCLKLCALRSTRSRLRPGFKLQLLTPAFCSQRSRHPVLVLSVNIHRCT